MTHSQERFVSTQFPSDPFRGSLGWRHNLGERPGRGTDPTARHRPITSKAQAARGRSVRGAYQVVTCSACRQDSPAKPCLMPPPFLTMDTRFRAAGHWASAQQGSTSAEKVRSGVDEPKGKNMLSRTVMGGGLTAAAALALLVPSAAQADPARNGDTISLTCGGQTFQVVLAGNGDWLPAHDINSNRIFIPTTFGESTGTVTVVSTGEVLDQFSDPPIWKGQATKERGTSVNCTYGSSFEFYDEELQEDLHITFTGSVGGFYTPARG